MIMTLSIRAISPVRIQAEMVTKALWGECGHENKNQFLDVITAQLPERTIGQFYAEEMFY